MKKGSKLQLIQLDIDYIVTLYIIDKKVVTFIKEITIKKKIALMLSLIYFVYFISM